MKQIETIHLFPELNKELIKLLRSLSLSDWQKQSPVRDRTIKDLASHLLDIALRRLSQQRDGFYDITNEISISSYAYLIDLIQGLNKEWILASRRISPKILIDLLEYPGRELYEYLMTLKPGEKAYFPVTWAGEDESENWTISDESKNHTGTEIELSENIAWILFTNTDREKEKYKSLINIRGNKELGLKILDFTAVMS